MLCVNCGQTSAEEQPWCDHCGQPAWVQNLYVLDEFLDDRGPAGAVMVGHKLDSTELLRIEAVHLPGQDVSTVSRQFQKRADQLKEAIYPTLVPLQDVIVANFREMQAILFVEPWSESEPFSQLIGQRSFSSEDALDVLSDLVELLAFLQGFSPAIAHGAIHPEHVSRRLSDGMLQIRGADLVQHALDPSYQAPEAQSGQISISADIFSAAALVVSLITGLPAAQLRDPSGRMRWEDHLRGPISFGLRTMLQSMLNLDWRERPGHASELVAGIARIRQHPDASWVDVPLNDDELARRQRRNELQQMSTPPQQVPAMAPRRPTTGAFGAVVQPAPAPAPSAPAAQGGVHVTGSYLPPQPALSGPNTTGSYLPPQPALGGANTTGSYLPPQPASGAFGQPGAQAPRPSRPASSPQQLSGGYHMTPPGQPSVSDLPSYQDTAYSQQDRQPSRPQQPAAPVPTRNGLPEIAGAERGNPMIFVIAGVVLMMVIMGMILVYLEMS